MEFNQSLDLCTVVGFERNFLLKLKDKLDEKSKK